MSRSPLATSSRSLLIAILIVVLTGVVGAVANTPAAAQTADTRFLESEASASFPETIRFQLTAESSVPIQQVELFWHPATDPVLSVDYPEFEPGTRVSVTETIDMTINYMPPGTDIAYWWRVTDEQGNVAESEVATFTYMDNRQSWRTRTDGLVTVWWYEGDTGFADQVLRSANEAITRLSTRFDIQTTNPVRLLIYGNDDDFSSALAANSAEWIGGVAYPEYDLVVAQISPDGVASREIGRMIPHEISHLITEQATQNPYNTVPAWLDEGLATYNQVVEDSSLDSILQNAIDDGLLIPIQALNSSFPLDPDQARLSYAESESVVRFIIERYGDRKLGELLAIFRTGVSYDEAVASTLNVTIEELDAQWKDWLGYQGDAPDRAQAPSPSGDDSLARTIFVIFVSAIAFLTVLTLVTLGVFIAVRRRA